MLELVGRAIVETRCVAMLLALFAAVVFAGGALFLIAARRAPELPETDPDAVRDGLTRRLP